MKTLKPSANRWLRTLVIFQVLLLIFPGSVFASPTGTVPDLPTLPAGIPSNLVPSFTPSPVPSLNPANAATIGSCDKACTIYKETSAEQALTNACGVPPPPGTPPTQILNNGRTFANYSECQASIYGDGNTGKYGGPAARWGILGQHCDAMTLMKAGYEQDLISGIVYTASGAVCTAACVLSNTPWGKISELACTVADLATIGVDIAGEVVISQQAEKATSAWDHFMATTAGDRVSDGLAFAGASAGIAAAGVSVAQGGAQGFKKGAGTAGKSGSYQNLAVQSANKTATAAAEQSAKIAFNAANGAAQDALKESLTATKDLADATQKADAAKGAVDDAVKNLDAVKDLADSGIANAKDVQRAQDALTDAQNKADDAAKKVDDAKQAKSVADDAAKKAQNAATDAATKLNDAADAAKGASKGATKAKNAANLQRALVCASAAFLLASAGVKWAMYAQHQDNAAKECTKVKNMEGIGTANILRNEEDGSGGGNTAPRNASFDIAKKSQQGSVSVSTTPDGPRVDDNASTFPAGAVPQSAAASSQLFKAMPNLDKVPEALNKAGVPLSEIAKKLATTPPGATVASLFPDLPDDMVQQLKDIDKMALEGKLSMPGSGDAATPATYQGGGGGGGSSSGGGDLAGFGAKRGVAGGATNASKEIGFEKTKKEPLLLPADGDIFHGKFNGSIFQIISIRMGTTRERIDTLEWSTPLNRALMGLPPLSPHAPPPKSPSEVKK